MAFCGQCGFLLPPDAVSCPRCNSAVTSSWTVADINANAPTVISNPDKTEKAEESSSSKPDLVQEPNQSVDYNVSPTVSAYPPPVPPRKSNKWATLLITLLILLLVGATTLVLVVGPDRIIQMVRGGTIAPQTTPVLPTSQASTSVPPTPTAQSSLTPEQQAQSVIDRYYSAINSQDYQTAYNLWLNNPESYQNFANGFSDTSHDDYTFSNVVQQSEGKVQVNITIAATSISYQQTNYQGYYIVEQQQDGSWKITSAKIHKV